MADDSKVEDGETPEVAAAAPLSKDARATLNETQVADLAARMQAGLAIKDRRYRLKTYKACFVGDEAVKWLIAEGVVGSEVDAVRMGNLLMDAGVISHVAGKHAFKNKPLFYRFSKAESSGEHGHVPKNEEGEDVSWLDFLQPFRDDGDSVQPILEDHVGKVDDIPAEAQELEVWPLDEHNAKLLDNVHPARWVDPTPKGTYNMVVIGAGAGGLVTAAAAAGVGARVAIIESHLYGGDCLNMGCVPSKALLRCAEVAHEARTASEFGVTVGDVTVDFGKVMERMRKLRAQIAPNDSCERFTQLGVDVFVGRGKFTSKSTVEVNGTTLTFSKACVATGGRANVPNIPGLKDSSFITNATVFNLTERPRRFGVIGAGPIGLEMAQAFQRLGSEVTVFLRGPQILSKEDPDAAALVEASLLKDGVVIRSGVKYVRVVQGAATAASAGEGEGEGAAAEPSTAGAGAGAGAGGESEGKSAGRPAHGPITVVIEVDGKQEEVVVDELLVAAGRVPNVDLGLEAAGIEFDRRKGVHVNDKLQTTNSNVYAVGDVCSPFQFTHVADFMARIVIRNALFFGRSKFSSLIVPWVTYTGPEVAHVGLYEKDIIKRGIKYTTFKKDFAHIDRAILESQTDGFVKVHCRAGSDEILGATVVAAKAGEMISELTLAMQTKTGLGFLGSVIHPYPTQADAIRLAAGMYNRTRLTPTVKSLFNGLMKIRR